VPLSTLQVLFIDVAISDLALVLLIVASAL
jgi:hypothetical protein